MASGFRPLIVSIDNPSRLRRRWFLRGEVGMLYGLLGFKPVEFHPKFVFSAGEKRFAFCHGLLKSIRR
jgi:hypothetical protein